MEDRVILLTLESIISVYIKPTFLAIHMDSDGAVEIVISALQFKYMSVQERINYVFTLLSSRCHDIMSVTLVVISAFSGDEMSDVIENLFEGDQND